jgi:putative oxidoreductase
MTVQTHVRSQFDSGNAITAALAPHAHWLLRAGVASVFLFHGVGKFAGGLENFAGMMGLPLAVAAAVAIAELLAGAGIIAGATIRGALGDLATRLSGIAIIPVMIGAIAMVHWGQWSFVASETHPMGGMEFQVVLLLIGAWFAIRGNDA